VAFFDSFSRQHEGWLSTVEVLGTDVGAQVEACEQPLAGVTADLGAGDQDVISILVGAAPDRHVAHMIHAPAHVRLKETESRAHEALQIESKSGDTTLLRFRTAAAPETLDGVVHEVKTRAIAALPNLGASYAYL
jgi:hypothetical protein